MTIHRFTTRAANGEAVKLSDYAGKALLIVNTASQCGFTPQYADLQALHETYEARGLVVMGFPCNQFGGQEPGTAEEVQTFCSVNYGVTFPIFEKVEAIGPNADPIFRYLTDATGAEIKWNFTKFLVDKEGKAVKAYESAAKPLELGPDIEAVLGE
ncbi:glutathione peroxidase [Paenibacillaceae bacterium WGS1546]|uniref:glutathione peroxidase n=1 Tax=Cohnella sp. WGS1546 TaxID=3366810 RepID=UPI00372D3773